MKSPIYSGESMEEVELERGLPVYACRKSGGYWIPLVSYFTWRDRTPVDDKPLPATEEIEVADDSKRPAMICPESGRLLLRYRAGRGLAFHIDRSPATGGFWLDRGEWEALKAKGLHREMHMIFTPSYQHEVRMADYATALAEKFKDRIGAADFDKIAEMARWIASHPKKRDICCYLFDTLEHKPDATP